MRKDKFETNRTVCKRMYKMELDSLYGYCPICPPNKGCNTGRDGWPQRNWKKFRKTQYKIGK